MTESAARIDVALPLPLHQSFTYRIDTLGRGASAPAPGTRVLVPFRREIRVGWSLGEATGDGWSGTVQPVLSVLDGARPAVTPELLSLCRWMSEYYVAPLGMCLRAALPTALCDTSRDHLVLTGTSDSGLRPRESRIVGALLASRGPVNAKKLARDLKMGSIWPEVRALTGRGIIRHETIPPSDPLPKMKRIAAITRILGTLDERERAFGRAKRQRQLYEALEAAGGAAELSVVYRGWGFSRAVVKGLEGRGLIELGEEEEVRDPFAGGLGTPPRLTPNAHQRKAIDELVRALDRPSSRPFLLHGVTGSGKTLVYVELIREALKHGRGAIILVPEISLTPQTVSRFREHFGNQVAVLHSGLSDGERYDAWTRLRDGRRRIAVGARSAIFAPLPDVGVIVVDEEHDHGYKQSESPRYQARDLAVVRAGAADAVCLLGSATPSLESWRNAQIGKFRRLDLPERAGEGRMPEVRVVDLREKGPGAFSAELVAAVKNRLGRGEQVLLLLNRRGYSSFVQCRDCGDVEQCPNCSISLTYHRGRERVECHHCGYFRAAPRKCIRCSSESLSFRGLGTQQVERITADTFPGARIARMDVDTTSGKWAHRQILDRFAAGEVDILLGTQMIAKGLDFHGVTLAGVVNADVGIHLPDFRATERTFQLVSQVAGRAGRGRLAGTVVVQTRLPGHYAVQAAVNHDFHLFAERELESRQHPAYPPFVRLLNVVVSSPDQRLVASTAEGAAEWLNRWIGDADDIGPDDIGIVGPAPSPIERLHRRWRWHFLVRSASPALLGRAARAIVHHHRPPSGDVRLVVDRDPQALM